MMKIDAISVNNTYPTVAHTQNVQKKGENTLPVNHAERNCWLPDILRQSSGSDIRQEKVEKAKNNTQIDSSAIADALLSLSK